MNQRHSNASKLQQKAHANIGVAFFALTLLSVFHFSYASDAALFISPITAIYTTGETVTLTVVVTSGGESVNAVEGKLEYDPKEVAISGVDASSSSLTSWTIFPTFANDVGELSFAGLLSTSTVLERGQIFKFSMKTLRSGEIHIRIGSGAAVHAADGTGGNILTSLHEGVYNVIPSESASDVTSLLDNNNSVVTATTSATSSGEVLGAATGTPFTSTTFPDQDVWYSTTTGVFTWNSPSGVVKVLFALNKKPTGDGIISYDPTLNEKTIKNIDQGISYVHFTEMYADGSKKTTNYRVKIDTAPPSAVTVSEKPRSDSADPNIVVLATATDTLSGIYHYEFAIDGKNSLTWNDDGSHEAHLPTQSVGTHDLVITVFDEARNSTSARLQFSVGYLPAPTASLLTKNLSEGNKMSLTIDSLPNSHQSVSIARGDESPSIEEFIVDANGHGQFVSAILLEPGTYHVWVVAHDARGAISKESDHLEVVVGASLIGIIKRHQMIPVALIAFVVLCFGCWIFWRRMRNEDGEEEMPDEEDNDSDDWVDRSSMRANTQQTLTVGRGTVILGKRELPRMPVTRL